MTFRKFSLLLSITLLTGFAAPPALAQIPGLPSLSPSAKPVAAPEQSDEERLKQWLEEARVSLARVDAPNAETNLPEGVPVAALADLRRDLDQTIRNINRTLSLLAEIADAKKNIETAKAANETWNRFTEEPPYSILMIDELANQREAAKAKNATYQSSISIFERTLENIQKEAKAANDLNGQVSDQVEKTKNDAIPNAAAKWHLEAAKVKSRLISVRSLSISTNIDLLKHQATAAGIELSLLDRKLQIAQRNARFTDEDLAKVEKAASDRQASIRKELSTIRQRLRTATTAKAAAQTAVDQLAAEPVEGTTNEALTLATLRLSVAESKFDALQFITENLEGMESLESFIPEAYRQRKALLEAKSIAEKNAPLQALQLLHDRLNNWETVTTNELTAVLSDINSQDSLTSSISAEDPRFAPLAEQRAALWEKQAFIQRVSQTVTNHRRLISRWQEEFKASEADQPWFYHVRKTASDAWDVIRQVWSFQVFQYSETIDGRPVSRGVPLGKFFTALTLFFIAYLLSTSISKRLQRVVVGRGHIAEAQANTLRNWLMIVVGLVLAVTTLHFLSIPLTVFAFFGGALAIGLGFGTQTLIKNFISGIIVLFERKIRVGDIVDIGGLSGSVSEINTRSSVLRSADGRETLVPNSVFLENSVTNLTLSNRTSRRAIIIGVAYGTQPQQVITVLSECAERHGLVLKDPGPLVIFQDFADNSLVFKLYFWTAFDVKTNPELVESDIRIMIEKRFSETGISMPFPQRDLHLAGDKPLEIQIRRREKNNEQPVSSETPADKPRSKPLP